MYRSATSWFVVVVVVVVVLAAQRFVDGSPVGELNWTASGRFFGIEVGVSGGSDETLVFASAF